MKTSSAKKRSFLIGLLFTLPLVCITGTIFFFARMYQRDIQKLTDFIISYQAYDQAVSAASELVFTATAKSTSTVDAEERLAVAALSTLKTRSSVRISSLIKNEKEAMRVMQEIADLSEKEIRTLEAYQQAASQDPDRDGLARDFHDLTKERQAAFAHFQELGK